MSGLRNALWKSLQEMLTQQEKSVHEIATAVGGMGAGQQELEQSLLRLRPTDLLARASAAQERWVGLPFTFHHEGRLWSGTIDLAFFAQDAWVVGHFLLDALADTQTQLVAVAHKTPLLLHAFVLEHLTGRRVQEVALVAVRSGEVATVTWGDAERNVVAAGLTRSSSFGGARQ
jgi:hypothetical protein